MELEIGNAVLYLTIPSSFVFYKHLKNFKIQKNFTWEWQKWLSKHSGIILSSEFLDA